MSLTIHGIGVSGGIAIGHAHLVSHTKLEVSHYDIPAGQVADESSRFDAAVKTVRDELELLRSSVPVGAPAEFGAFIDLHLMILADSTLSEAPRTIIRNELCNAEWALKVQTDELLQQFDAIEDSYLRERRTDVIQVAQRVMKALSGQPGYTPPPAGDSERNLVLVAHSSEVHRFSEDRLAHIATRISAAPELRAARVEDAALYLGGPSAVNAEASRYAAVTVSDLRRVARTYLRAESALTLLISSEAR